jgi:hypothetical protein
MGSETTKALLARRREAAAQVERLIAAAEERSHIGASRLARIKSATREGRRALRALDSAERTLAEAETQVGTTLLRLTQDGLSRSEAYKSLGISRAIGRRLIELAAGTRRTSVDSSMDAPTERASIETQADSASGASREGGASNEGNA